MAVTVPEAVALAVRVKWVESTIAAIAVLVLNPVPVISWPATRPVVEATVTELLPFTVVTPRGTEPATLTR